MFAKSGKKTLVVGADLRRPRMYVDFGLTNDIGMSNHILGDKSLSDVIVQSDIKNLDIDLSKRPGELSSDTFYKIAIEYEKLFN